MTLWHFKCVNKYLSFVDKIPFMISCRMPYLKSYMIFPIYHDQRFFFSLHMNRMCVYEFLHYTIYNMLPDILEYPFVCRSRLDLANSFQDIKVPSFRRWRFDSILRWGLFPYNSLGRKTRIDFSTLLHHLTWTMSYMELSIYYSWCACIHLNIKLFFIDFKHIRLYTYKLYILFSK